MAGKDYLNDVQECEKKPLWPEGHSLFPKRRPHMAGKDYLHDVQECEKKPLWQRIGWLLVIWTGSVATLAVFAWLIRMFMTAAGMKSH